MFLFVLAVSRSRDQSHSIRHGHSGVFLRPELRCGILLKPNSISGGSLASPSGKTHFRKTHTWHNLRNSTNASNARSKFNCPLECSFLAGGSYSGKDSGKFIRVLGQKTLVGQKPPAGQSGIRAETSNRVEISSRLDTSSREHRLIEQYLMGFNTNGG